MEFGVGKRAERYLDSTVVGPHFAIVASTRARRELCTGLDKLAWNFAKSRSARECSTIERIIRPSIVRQKMYDHTGNTAKTKENDEHHNRGHFFPRE
jgi:hypothetical protein